MQSKLDTMQMVEGVKAVSEQISNIIQQFLSRPRQIAAVVVLRSIIQTRLGRPALVRETSFSRSILPEFLERSLAVAYRILRKLIGLEKSVSGADGGRVLPIIEATFKDVILETEAKERVILLAQATRNTKLSQAPYRHVLLHGPPGTGKTLIGG
jgi:ATPase family AAA domain-containing protein 3A/B